MTYRAVGARMAIRRYMAVLLSTPAMGFQVLRWCFRKPIRIGGLAGLVWSLTELLKMAGVFSTIHGWLTSFYQNLQKVKDSVTEASDMALETWEMMVLWYNAIAALIDPWKIPAYMIVGYLVIRLYVEIESSESPGTTPGNSGAATPVVHSPTPDTPGEPSRDAALQSVSVAMMNQGEILEKVAERLRLLESLSKEEAEEASAVRDARFESKSEKLTEALASQTKTWESMNDRLEHFEKILEEDKLGPVRAEPLSPDGVPAWVASSPFFQPDPLRADGVLAEEVEVVKTKKSASQIAKEGPEMSVLIKGCSSKRRLRRKSMCKPWTSSRRWTRSLGLLISLRVTGSGSPRYSWGSSIPWERT